MNSFEQMGAAQLLAHYGQRQVAQAAAAAIGRAVLRVVDLLGRHLPENKAAPW